MSILLNRITEFSCAVFLISESAGLHCKACAFTSKHPVQRNGQSGADSVLLKGQDLLVMRPSSVTLLGE